MSAGEKKDDNRRLRLRAHLDATSLERVLQFGLEMERLWVTPIGGETEKRVLLTVQNHYDPERTAESGAPLLVDRTVKAPCDHELAAMAMQFRIFVLNDEPTHFPSIKNIVSRGVHLAGLEEPKAYFKSLKHAWHLPEMVLLGCPVNGETLLDLWLNGERFHRVAEKRRQLDQLRAQVGGDQVRIWLMAALTFASSVLIEFHMTLRDKTDLYNGAPFASDASPPANTE